MNILNKLFKQNIIEGEVVNLQENYRVNEETSYDGVPAVFYNIYNKQKQNIGRIELRFSIEGDNYYYGHVGYNIKKEYRGHNYAYYACKVLFKIAKDEFNMSELIITCSPENIASHKTLLKLNGELIDFVEVPKNHTLYMYGETSKYIFKYKLGL